MNEANDEATQEAGAENDTRLGDPREEPDEDTKQGIEKERAERLDPENRPENAEVDNTPREFDVDRGMFTDSDEYTEDEPAPFKDPEDPNGDEDEDEDED